MADIYDPREYDPSVDITTDLDRAEDSIEEQAEEEFEHEVSDIRCTGEECRGTKPYLDRFFFPVSHNVKLECPECDGHIIFDAKGSVLQECDLRSEDFSESNATMIGQGPELSDM